MYDPQLIRRIIAELESEPTVDVSRIDLNIVDGMVTLTGSVTSFRQKNTVGSTVRNVSGVGSVVNLIEVEPGVATLPDGASAGSVHEHDVKPGLVVP
ncbi:BON domain-containing protein [Cognatiluteimonas profundi]|uniref:BON domain-containing protein n=1 Tax=Cognatiluteimonas profundi TaxID=2594501 RepID=UPI00131C9A4E|nr:BON domain-containing protein [Lysobacter profundi]